MEDEDEEEKLSEEFSSEENSDDPLSSSKVSSSSEYEPESESESDGKSNYKFKTPKRKCERMVSRESPNTYKKRPKTTAENRVNKLIVSTLKTFFESVSRKCRNKY